MMTIEDKALQSFFLKQKKASVDSLLPRQKIQQQTSGLLSSKDPIDNTLTKDNSKKSLSNPALQMGEKSVSNALAIREQVVSNALAMREQSVSKKEDIKQEKFYSMSKALAEPLADALAKREQSVSKDPKEAQTDFVVGNERMLLSYLFKKCQSIGSLETNAITTDELTKLLKIKPEHIRNLVFRLTKKELIKISKIKNGRAGWRKFMLSKDIFQQLILAENISSSLAKREQSVSKALAKALAEPLATFPSSGGINNIDLKTTTTNSNPARELAEGWREVEYSLLAHIGFTQTHLLQLSKLESLAPSIVQDSIYHFAFDLKHNNKASSIKGDPLNYFMGIVSKRGAYTAPSNYIDPVLEVMNSYHKTKEQSEKQKAEIEQKVQEIEFKNWHDNLSDSEILELIPDEIRNGFGGTPALKQTLKTQFLKKYYRETLWSERRRELCSSTPNWTTVEPTAT
jgi:hypothetical protein